MRRLTIPLVLLLALGVAGFLLLDLDCGRSPTRDGEPAPGPDPGPAPPILRGRGTTPPIPAPALEPHPVPAVDPLSAADEVGDAMWIVRGTIRGLDPALPGGVQVYAHPVLFGFSQTEQRVLGAAPEGASFELDVSPLFADGQTPSHVEVVVDHPAYAKERKRIDVADTSGGDPRVLRTEIMLRLANAITGTVVDEDGTPEVGVAVALFPTEDGMPRFQHVLPLDPLDLTMSDGEGGFRLRTVEDGTFFIVAASDHLCPDSRMVERPRGKDREINPLVLRTGHAISGRVTWQGQGVSGAALEATHYEGAFELRMGPYFVSWAEGNILAANRRAIADADGLYRIEALTPANYRVIAHVELPDLDCVSPLVVRRLGRNAVPPAAGIDLDVQGVPLCVRVFADGSPLEGAVVQVEARGSWINCVTDAEGSVDVLLAADAAAELHLRHDGYAPADVDIPAAHVGTTVEKVVELESATPRADVVIVLEGELAPGISKLSVSLAPPDRPSGNFGPPSSLDREEGIFRLRRVEAGQYLLTVHPGRESWQVSGYYLDERRTVEVPDRGEVHVPVEVRFGGRIRIAARDEEGGLLAATCVVRNDRGNEVSVVFVSQTDAMSMSQGETLGDLSPSLVDPPLEAGAYTVELHMEGRVPRTLEVDVNERETADIDVVLPEVR